MKIDTSCKCNNLDFHGDTLWQFLDSNTAARRLMGEMLLVDLVYLAKGIHAGEKDGRLDNFLYSRVACFKNTFDVGDASLSQNTHRLGKVNVAALLGRELTAGEDEASRCGNGYTLALQL